MLRLVLLLLYLTALFSGSQAHESGGGLDPNGLTTPPPSDSGAGWDPSGRPSPPPSDWGGGWDPNG